jgi:hypothetical protein
MSNYYLEILKSNECPHCDDFKERGYVFCGSCYFSLPEDMRGDLYRMMRDGFEEAVDAALEWLRL